MLFAVGIVVSMNRLGSEFVVVDVGDACAGRSKGREAKAETAKFSVLFEAKT